MHTPWKTTKLFVVGPPDEKLDPLENRTVSNQLKPILWSLRLLGAYSGIHEDVRRSVRSWYHDVSMWTCITLGLLHAYALASFTSCITGDFWAAAYPFCRTGCAVASSHAVISKGRQVRALMSRLGTFPSRPWHNLRKTCAVMALSVWGYVFLRVAVHCMMLLGSDGDGLSKHASTTWFGVESQLPASVLLPLCLVDVIMNGILVDGSLLLSAALYLALTVALRHRYEAFNDAINRYVRDDVVHQEPSRSRSWMTTNDGPDAHDLRRLRQLRADLGVAVLQMDTLFSPTAFAWVSFFVLGVCVEVSRFVGHHDSGLGDRHQFLVFGE
ncbi:unnamed protein product [Ixodes hexagonus]